MNYICTWFCADEIGEESHFPQTGKSSSSQQHQDIYWRCILVFFSTSKRFNTFQKHVLFTNVKKLPFTDGLNVEKILFALDVEIVFTDFKYKTPKGYYGHFQNQFYEFSILEYISNTNNNLNDNYLVLDSDYIFLKPADELFKEAMPAGFLSFKDDVKPDYIINGLSRNDLKAVYEGLLKKEITTIPPYHLGEFFLCSVKNIKQIFSDFQVLWPQLLHRNAIKAIKFNEEAHTLSYLYFINDLHPSNRKDLMKRIWTNPVFYRNVEPSDANLILWHLPSEKTFGIKKLYDDLFKKTTDYGKSLNNDKYIRLAKKRMGVPGLSVRKKIEYYFLSYYRAAVKRINLEKLIFRKRQLQAI